MIDFKEILDGETWELFARDFLTELGFFIESSPDRGPDAGKDILVSEELVGSLGRYRLRWLVSCKHHSVSGKSVNETDEQNILERIEAFEADGFIGFYSTIPSSGLGTRLLALRNNQKIKDFRIFDHKLIENHLVRVGYSTLLMRYFPESYKVVKPLHLIVSEYISLNCKNCGKDLLKSLYNEEYGGNVAFTRKTHENFDYTQPDYVEEVYWSCKGDCDVLLQRKYWEERGLLTRWMDISDLAIPAYFLRFILSTMNVIRGETKIYSDAAYEQLKTFIMALAQKVLRETTARERDRVRELIDLSSIGR